MAHHIYLIQLRDEVCDDDDARDALAELIHRVGGFVLMAVGAQALIAAFDEQWQGAIGRQRAVALCGGLHLDPNGAAADKLRRLFAANVAAQIGTAPADDAPAPGARHRALVWHRPAPASATHDDGIRVTTTTTTTPTR